MKVNKNLRLKAKIIENFENQWRFAQEVKRPEAYVSNVIRGAVTLPLDEQQQWAERLNCKAQDIFAGTQV